jgi:hypothetical protein
MGTKPVDFIVAGMTQQRFGTARARIHKNLLKRFVKWNTINQQCQELRSYKSIFQGKRADESVLLVITRNYWILRRKLMGL